ncbi:hypothetical protein F511_47626 [Dorcoceras hygrometricum]|uniref:Uncharacterized protein n=1 Tax=Dorcoceras hygrometricum TaxID=472368 RepID=A0A2Z6ZR48_9LAMI|nr:hypothetical protein F511_47626 [Dorcoceras hygrometricum]
MQAGTTLSAETPAKPPGNTDGGLVKKLKEFDGLAMSIGNGNGNSTDDAADNEVTQRFVEPLTMNSASRFLNQ